MPRQPPTAAIPTEVATTDDIPLGDQLSYDASTMAPFTSGAINYKQVWGDDDGDTPPKATEPTMKNASSETIPQSHQTRTSEIGINTTISAKPFTAPAYMHGTGEAQSDEWWGQDLCMQDGLLSQATNLDDLPPALTDAVKSDSILTAPALAMRVVTELMRSQAEDDAHLHACWKRLPANAMPCPIPSALPFPLLSQMNSLNPYMMPTMYQSSNIMVGGQPVQVSAAQHQQSATEGEPAQPEQPKKRRRRRHRGRGRRGRGRKKTAEDEEGEGEGEGDVENDEQIDDLSGDEQPPLQ